MWSPTNILDIKSEVTMHHLNMDPLYQSIKQKKWNFILEWQKVIVEEVDKLISIDFIREVTYLN